MLQFEAKAQKEEYSEKLLQQDFRYNYYLDNLDRIILKDEIVARQCYDETGRIKYHQILLLKHLLKKLLQALTARHPNTPAYLNATRNSTKILLPGIANLVKTWLERCKTLAKDKRVQNNAIMPELLKLKEWKGAQRMP